MAAFLQRTRMVSSLYKHTFPVFFQVSQIFLSYKDASQIELGPTHKTSDSFNHLSKDLIWKYSSYSEVLRIGV